MRDYDRLDLEAQATIEGRAVDFYTLAAAAVREKLKQPGK